MKDTGRDCLSYARVNRTKTFSLVLHTKYVLTMIEWDKTRHLHNTLCMHETISKCYCAS